MKGTLFILLFLSTISGLKSQVVFCPKGAEWHYLFLDFNLCQNCTYSNEHVIYSRDSVLAGDTVKVLHHTRFYSYFNHTVQGMVTLIRQGGDTIWFRNSETAHTWQVLLNFNQQVNDFWTVKLNGSAVPQYTFVTTGIGDTTVNGRLLKRIYITTPGNMSYSTPITERIGFPGYMFPFFGNESDGDVFAQQLCYKDDSLGLVQFSGASCNSVKPDGVGEVSFRTDISVFPNPATESVHIKGMNIGTELSVLSIHGENLFSQIQSNPDGVMSVKALPSGIYFIKVQEKSSVPVLIKLLKD